MGTFTAIGVALAAVAWCLLRVVGAVAQRIGDRIAAWLLPDGQPVTFRLAFGLAVLARFVSPRTVLILLARDTGSLVPTLIFYRPPNTWKGPTAAVEELRKDLASGRTVKDPVQFVWPLLPIAVSARLHNVLQLLIGGAAKIVWLPLTLAGPAIGGLIRGWPGVIALGSLALAGFTDAAMGAAVGICAIGFGLNLALRGVAAGLSSTFAWLSPAALTFVLAEGCRSFTTYPLADLGWHGTYVVLGLAATTLACFLTDCARRTAVDPLVESILWKPRSASRRRRLGVTRLYLACELATVIARAAALYGVAAFATASVFAVDQPIAWVAAGLVATIASAYPQAAAYASSLLRPPVCFGDDARGGGADMLANYEAAESYRALSRR